MEEHFWSLYRYLQTGQTTSKPLFNNLNRLCSQSTSLKDVFFRPFNHSDRLPLILLPFISILQALLKHRLRHSITKTTAPVTRALPPDSYLTIPSLFLFCFCFLHPKISLIVLINLGNNYSAGAPRTAQSCPLPQRVSHSPRVASLVPRCQI